MLDHCIALVAERDRGGINGIGFDALHIYCFDPSTSQSVRLLALEYMYRSSQLVRHKRVFIWFTNWHSRSVCQVKLGVDGGHFGVFEV